MELNKINLEFDNQEINALIKQLNELHKHQQSDFANLCYTIYKIDCWFTDHGYDEVIWSNTKDYYDRKKLFKALGFSNKQVNRYSKCYLRYMDKDDVGSKLKEPFVSFTSSKLIELLPFEIDFILKWVESGQISATMTIKELREFLKSLEKGGDQSEIEEENQVDSTENQNFLVLKNDTMRNDFLDNYKTWGLWFEEPRLKLKYYRCKIGEKVLMAISSISTIWGDKSHEVVGFHYLNSLGAMSLYESSLNEIISDMKSISDKRVYLLD